MKTRLKLGLFAAMTLAAIMFAPLPAFAGNPHWGEQQLDLSRAKALRARCMDEHGRCIEAMMLGDNSQYRCPMQRHKVTDAAGIQAGAISTMYCE